MIYSLPTWNICIWQLWWPKKKKNSSNWVKPYLWLCCLSYAFESIIHSQFHCCSLFNSDAKRKGFWATAAMLVALLVHLHLGQQTTVTDPSAPVLTLKIGHSWFQSVSKLPGCLTKYVESVHLHLGQHTVTQSESQLHYKWPWKLAGKQQAVEMSCRTIILLLLDTV